MHRLQQEDDFIYNCLRKNLAGISTKLENMINQFIAQNAIIMVEGPDVSSELLDDYYFSLSDGDEQKVDEYFYAARLISAKEFLERNELCDAVYELIYAFDDKDKIKQYIKNLMIYDEKIEPIA